MLEEYSEWSYQELMDEEKNLTEEMQFSVYLSEGEEEFLRDELKEIRTAMKQKRDTALPVFTEKRQSIEDFI